MSQPPLFTIIVPTYRRPAQLADCLKALAALDFPTNKFEVIIVDDGGGTLDETFNPLREHGLQWTLREQPNAGPAAARNLGAAHAKGRYLAFTDDDCQPARDWLTHLAAGFAAQPRAMLGGQTINALTGNIYAAASQLLVDFLYDYYNCRDNQPAFFTSNNFAVAAAQFHELGGFDTRYPRAAGEDRAFCEAWRRAGYSLVLLPQMRLAHAHAMGARGFWRQHFNYGRAAFHFHRHNQNVGGKGVKSEPLAFYWQIISYPLRGKVAKAFRLSGLLFLAQAANALGYFREAALS